MKGEIEGIEDFMIVAVAIVVVIVLFGIISDFSPKGKDSFAAGGADSVNKFLAEKAQSCFLKHRQGLDSTSDVCETVEIDSWELPTEEGITGHLNCADMPNSDCAGCSLCVSEKIPKQDSLSTSLTSTKGPVIISYSGRDKKVVVKSLGCRKDSDCDLVNSCAVSTCVNPNSPDSFCQSVTQCSLCAAQAGVAGSDWCASPVCRSSTEGGFCSDGIDNDCDGKTDMDDTDCSARPDNKAPNPMHIVFVPVGYASNEFDDFNLSVQKFIAKWLAVSPFKECTNPAGHLDVEILKPGECSATCEWSACIGNVEPTRKTPCGDAVRTCTQGIYNCAKAGTRRTKGFSDTSSYAVGYVKGGTTIPSDNMVSFVTGIYDPSVINTVVGLPYYINGSGVRKDRWEVVLQEFGHSMGVECHTSTIECAAITKQPPAPAPCMGNASWAKFEPDIKPFPGDIMDYCPGMDEYNPHVYDFLKTADTALKQFMAGCKP